MLAGTDPLEKICAGVMKRREVKMRWCRTEILVIDEISMLSAELFDVLSFVGQYTANAVLSRPALFLLIFSSSHVCISSIACGYTVCIVGTT
jgi:hypothetical protein